MDHLSIAPEKPAQLLLRPPLAPGEQIRVVNHDDLRRSRPTVFFRFFLALPHLVWLNVWGQGMLIIAPIYWVWTLIAGRAPEDLRDVYALFVRYATHVYAYWLLAAEPFPGFLGRPGTYPIDIDLAPAARQSRWSIGFRLVLVFPAAVLASALLAANPVTYLGVALLASTGAWFFVMATGRMPQGLRDLTVWCLGYAAQTYAYLFLLTGRYPTSDPALAPSAPLPAHPVRLELSDELRRNRWLVAFRYVLAAPHNIWWLLWTALAIVVAFLGWLAALVLGRLPRPLHRFLAAWVRYSAHFNAFFWLGGGLFPGFLGRAGSYPVDVAIDAPERQSRWAIGFRALLALPALLLSVGILGVVVLAGIGGWFFALIMGRMPRGLRNVIAFAMRYVSQTFAYLVLVSPRYPYSGPGELAR